MQRQRKASDDFFSNFDQSPPRNQRPPPPPPPPGAARRPAPPPYGQSNYVLSGQQQQQQSYYGSAPTSPVAPPSPPQQQHSFGYSQQQPQQNDWYTPPPAAIMQPPQGFLAPQQPQPAIYGSSSFMEGSMDSSGQGMMHQRLPQTFMQPQTFIPQQPAPNNDLNPYYYQDNEDEPPLLEELGINVEHIFMKTKAVVVPFRRFQKHSALADPAIIVEDADLAGPLAIALLLGGELLMSGKLQFGYIYGFGLFGCLAMTVILNLMSPEKPISFWTVTSVLGYSLLPVNVLALLKIVLLGHFSRILAIFTVLWSTTASTRLLETGCGMAKQRFLLAYPIALLYSAFVLITIF